MSQALPEGWTPPKWLAQFSKIELAYLAEKRHETALREHLEMRAWMARALTAERRLAETSTDGDDGPAPAPAEVRLPRTIPAASEASTGAFAASTPPHGRAARTMDLMNAVNLIQKPERPEGS